MTTALESGNHCDTQGDPAEGEPGTSGATAGVQMPHVMAAHMAADAARGQMGLPCVVIAAYATAFVLGTVGGFFVCEQAGGATEEDHDLAWAHLPADAEIDYETWEVFRGYEVVYVTWPSAVVREDGSGELVLSL